jgi:hypothetical protein
VAEVGGSQVPSQPGILSQTLSKEKQGRESEGRRMEDSRVLERKKKRKERTCVVLTAQLQDRCLGNWLIQKLSF